MGSCARPMADFTFGEVERTAPARIDFLNNSKGAEHYEWDFGDGNASILSTPTHEYKSSGNYTVRLKAQKGRKTSVLTKNMLIHAPLSCLVEIETSYGTMLIRLSDATPIHRDNFIQLVEEAFYDGLLFHRVVEGFMIQGGDPNSRNAVSGQMLGVGGSGYTIPAEFVDSLVHVKGALCAARLSDEANPEKRSSGSQFYIVQGSSQTEEKLDMAEARRGVRYSKAQREAYLSLGGAPQLDGAYTVFGQVVKGLDVIDKIANAKTDPASRPFEDIKMKIRVIN